MIGVLITTHGELGSELIKAAELIKGPMKGVPAYIGRPDQGP